MSMDPLDHKEHPEKVQVFIIDPESDPELTPEEHVPPEEIPLYVEESMGDCAFRKNTTAWD